MYNFNARNIIVLHNASDTGNFIRSLFTLNADTADTDLLINNEKLANYKDFGTSSAVLRSRQAGSRSTTRLTNRFDGTLYKNINTYTDLCDTYIHSCQTVDDIEVFNQCYISHTNKDLTQYQNNALVCVQHDQLLADDPEYTTSIFSPANVATITALADQYNMKCYVIANSTTMDGDISGIVAGIASEMGYRIDCNRSDLLEYVNLYRTQKLTFS